MEIIKNKFTAQMNLLKSQSEKVIVHLQKENRDDEARVEKIKINLIDLFLNVFDVSYRQAVSLKGDIEFKQKELIRIYGDYFIRIPSAWQKNLDEAKMHDDFETIYVEEAKLKMAQKIKSFFIR